MFYKFIFFLIVFSFFSSRTLQAISTINYDTNQLKEGEYEPWFTGPIIAGSGRTMTPGHFNLEPYFFIQQSNGSYNNEWHKKRKLGSVNFNPLIFFVTGLNSFMDFQLVTNFQSNFRNHQKNTRIGDSLLGLGFQLCLDNRFTASPDIRLILKQELATGHYKHLNPKKLGTDASGSGFYRTGVGLNIQKLFYFHRRLLLARCNMNYKISTPTYVSGYTVFGGGPNIRGQISSVQFFNIDFAFEYTLSQNLVFAMDLFYEYQSKGRFKPKGKLPLHHLPLPRSDQEQRYSLAPALEYNFSAAFGIIAGCWFSIAGKNSNSFTTGVIAFNYVK